MNDEKDEGESWWEHFKTIIIFVVVILVIVGIMLALAPHESNTIPTYDDLSQDWAEENYAPRYDEP